MELIEREALLKAHKPSMGFLSVRKMIEEAPAIDAAPVVHGWWDRECTEDGELMAYFCSVCNRSHNAVPSMRYCPDCGAKMDGGEDNA